MKFKTTDLIARIDSILAIREAEIEAQKLDAEAKEREGRQDWYDDYAEGFREMVKQINATLKVGQPITYDVVPTDLRERYNGVKFYTAPSKWGSDDHKTESLRKLRNALQASQEDTVSPTAIKQLGFQDVTFLFTSEAGK